jgi:hypothetical protein
LSVGFGVFTTRRFGKGEFLLEYRGRRLAKPPKNTSYLFGFKHNGKYIW